MKKKIHNEATRILASTGAHKDLVTVSVAIGGEFGYIELGNWETSYPNTLYRRLKEIEGVDQVMVQIGGFSLEIYQ